MVRIILCPRCGLLKQYKAKGFCSRCYYGWYTYHFITSEEQKLKTRLASAKYGKKKYWNDPEYRSVMLKRSSNWSREHAVTLYDWYGLGVRVKINKKNEELYRKELKKTEDETYERILENIGDILESV